MSHLDEYEFYKWRLTRRQVEAIIWCHTAFSQHGDVEFLDANLSLGKLVGFTLKKDVSECSLRNPWSPTIHTLVGSTVLIMRARGVIRPIM